MATLSCSVMLGSQSGKGSSFSNLVIVLLKPWAAISYLGEAQLTPATSHTTLYFHLQCLDGQSRLERAARPDRANKCHIAAERSRCSARYFRCIQFFRHFSTSGTFLPDPKWDKIWKCHFQNVFQICQPYFSWLSSGAFPFVPNSDKPPPVPDYPSSPTFPY